MVFPILGGNSAVAGGYSIDNSLRFNGTADSCYLSRTPSSTTDRQKFTISFWVKRAKVITRENMLFESRPSAGTYFAITFRNSGSADSDRILFQDNSGMNVTFAPTYRDVSAYFHIVASFDTTQATASNRAKLYVNGTQITDLGSLTTYPSQNANLNWNVNQVMSVGGSFDPTTQSPDIYLAEAHSIDGQQLDASSFGEFDESGIWKPKAYEGTYSGNSFYLDFENSGSLGADASGLGNNFTPTNLASTDQTTDTPTNNFATMNPLHSEGITFSEGNLDILASTTFWNVATSTIPIPTSGKWYMEAKITAIQAGGHNTLGFLDANFPFTTNDTATAFTGGGTSWITYVYFHASTDNAYVNLADGSGYSFSNNTTFSAGVNDILMMAFDRDNNKIWFGKNGDWAKANGTTGANPSIGADATVSSISTDVTYMPNFGCGNSSARQQWNFGNPPYTISSGNSDDNGYGNFEYAPPTGFLSLCTQNLATALSPTIDDGSQYFNTLLYTGDGTTRDITGMNYKPDLLWVKRRSSALHHRLWDTTRGAGYQLYSSLTSAEAYDITAMSAFLSDGFSIPSGSLNNTSSQTYVAWHWKANGGTTSSNTDGSITSTVQANTTAGFSIVTYTGNGTASTVGHGLGVKPKVVILKNRSSSTDWGVQMANTLGFTNALRLNLTDAYGGSNGAGWWNDTAPTTTTVSIGTRSEVNTSGNNYVMYCFNNVEGYSKFGKYTGNGSTDGTFVYTGFRPAFVIYKRTDAVENWQVLDAKRDIDNPVGQQLYPNLSASEGTENRLDFTSNGFKLRNGGTICNASGGTYIYLAFAENPFVTSSGVPVVAR